MTDSHPLRHDPGERFLRRCELAFHSFSLDFCTLDVRYRARQSAARKPELEKRCDQFASRPDRSRITAKDGEPVFAGRSVRGCVAGAEHSNGCAVSLGRDVVDDTGGANNFKDQYFMIGHGRSPVDLAAPSYTNGAVTADDFMSPDAPSPQPKAAATPGRAA